MDVENSLFLEDLAVNLSLEETVDLNEVDYLLSEADTFLYEQIYNEYDLASMVARDIVSGIVFAKVFDAVYKHYLETSPKFKTTAEEVIRRYEALPDSAFKKRKINIRNAKRVGYKNDRNSYGIVNGTFVNNYFKELNNFVNEFKKEDEFTDTRRKMLTKKIDRNLGIKIKLPKAGKTDTITNYKKYMEEYSRFVKNDFANFKNTLSKIEMMVEKFKDENYTSFQKLFIKNINKFVNNALKLISAYTFNANLIIKELEEKRTVNLLF